MIARRSQSLAVMAAILTLLAGTLLVVSAGPSQAKGTWTSLKNQIEKKTRAGELDHSTENNNRWWYVVNVSKAGANEEPTDGVVTLRVKVPQKCRTVQFTVEAHENSLFPADGPVTVRVKRNRATVEQYLLTDESRVTADVPKAGGERIKLILSPRQYAYHGEYGVEILARGYRC